MKPTMYLPPSSLRGSIEAALRLPLRAAFLPLLGGEINAANEMAILDAEKAFLDGVFGGEGCAPEPSPFYDLYAAASKADFIAKVIGDLLPLGPQGVAILRIRGSDPVRGLNIEVEIATLGGFPQMFGNPDNSDLNTAKEAAMTQGEDAPAPAPDEAPTAH